MHKRNANEVSRSRRFDMVLEVPLSEVDWADERFQFRIGSATSDIQASIRKHGQQVPITLWGRNPFLVIDGFRRIRALLALDIASVKAIIRDDLDEHAAFHLSFIENVKRRSWTQYEKALAVRVAIEHRGLSTKQVANDLTLSERQIQRYLQMAAFHPNLVSALESGRISMAQAALLHRIAPENLTELLADPAQLSAKALQKRLRKRRGRRGSYLSSVGAGFRMKAFQFNPRMAVEEKEEILVALERASETVRASLTDGAEAMSHSDRTNKRHRLAMEITR
jgi:ParB/RepB/Spo0J family partition protein